MEIISYNSHAALSKSISSSSGNCELNIYLHLTYKKCKFVLFGELHLTADSILVKLASDEIEKTLYK